MNGVDPLRRRQVGLFQPAQPFAPLQPLRIAAVKPLQGPVYLAGTLVETAEAIVGGRAQNQPPALEFTGCQNIG